MKSKIIYLLSYVLLPMVSLSMERMAIKSSPRKARVSPRVLTAAQKQKAQTGQLIESAKSKKAAAQAKITKAEFLAEFKKTTDEMWAKRFDHEEKFIKEMVSQEHEGITIVSTLDPVYQRDIASKYFPRLFIELYEQTYNKLYQKSFKKSVKVAGEARRAAEEQYKRHIAQASGACCIIL